MHAAVDAETCVGCGLCADNCTEVFEMEEGVAGVIVDEVPAEAEESCKEAAEACPVEAIKIKD